MTAVPFALVLCCFALAVNCNKNAKAPAVDKGVIDDVFGPLDDEPNTKPKGSPKQEITDPDYWDDDSKFNVSSKPYDAFDWNIIKRLSDKSNNNVLLSPFNLKTALGILGEAAAGVTRTEILATLDFPSDRLALREKFASLLKSLTTPSPDYIVNVGSRLYVAKDVAPRQKYMAIAYEFYNTEIKNLDFENPKQAAAEVNAWVAEATKGHIENLVTEDDIEHATMMILTTIYFKGQWRHQFPLNQTVLNNFYLDPKRQVSVPMMFQKAKFHYYDSSVLDAKILRMPYLGNKFAMYILLPNAVNGLQNLLKNLYAYNLRTELFLLREELVRVTMPKLKFDFLSHLVPVLKELGIREAFEDSASLPGIARGQTVASRFHVSNIVQKAGIEINEVGSTAYAATEISLVNKFGYDEDEEVDFFVNKPFIFYIEDESQRQILFVGTVIDPEQSKINIEVPVGPSQPNKVPSPADSKVPSLPADHGTQASPAPQGGKPVSDYKPSQSIETTNRFGGLADDSKVPISSHVQPQIVWKPASPQGPLTANAPVKTPAKTPVKNPSYPFNNVSPNTPYFPSERNPSGIQQYPGYPPSNNSPSYANLPNAAIPPSKDAPANIHQHSGWWYYYQTDLG